MMTTWPRRTLIVFGAVLGSLALPALAFAHLERPSYWPDPAPDRSVSPPAGGKVPECARSTSAVTGKGAGKVRVVCQGRGGWKSLDAAARVDRQGPRSTATGSARASPKQYLPSREAAQAALAEPRARAQVQVQRDPARRLRLRATTTAWWCMPGRYTEPTSRAQPLNDPRCADMTQTDSSGAKTPSYRYQVTCPNDQNLIHVAGPRGAGRRRRPARRSTNRQGIPDLGPLRALQPPARGHAAWSRPT